MRYTAQGWRRTLRRLGVSALLALAAACAAGPPIQEMSDARQAIAAAREAGAAQLAPEPLQAAQDQLSRAEADLQKGIYWRARESARQAKDDAVSALLKSRTLRDAARPAGSGAAAP